MLPLILLSKIELYISYNDNNKVHSISQYHCVIISLHNLLSLTRSRHLEFYIAARQQELSVHSYSAQEILGRVVECLSQIE